MAIVSDTFDKGGVCNTIGYISMLSIVSALFSVLCATLQIRVSDLVNVNDTLQLHPWRRRRRYNAFHSLQPCIVV